MKNSQSRWCDIAYSALLLIAALATPAAAEEWKISPSHPRLLITLDDLPALRVRCGTSTAASATPQLAPERAALDRLKLAATEIMRTRAGLDDLFVPAVLHLATGTLGRPDAYTDYVRDDLLSSERREFELDALFSLDCCWDAIEAGKRAEIVRRIAPALEPLDVGQSPLEHFSFSRKLNALAAAIVIFDPALPQSPATESRLRNVRAAGQKYLEGPFVKFCRERGAMPTSGDGTWEEADLVLAAELGRALTGRNLLADLRESLARSMEHYFYADTEYASLNHGFIHDDESRIPSRPGQLFRGFVPAVPFAIAHATGDAAAAWYAGHSVAPSATLSLETDRYQWARLLYGTPDQPVRREACPLDRDFGGGWVAMRSGWSPGATALLFDVGQPFWRARQHFDAGQFQIYRKGRLAIDSGDDVMHEAVAGRGGKTTIGAKPGDRDDYYQATIAHNCVTVTDPRFEPRRYGRLWPAIGNQRLIERDYTPAEGPLAAAPPPPMADKPARLSSPKPSGGNRRGGRPTAENSAPAKPASPRTTGRLLAFQSDPDFGYAAADLTAAYPGQAIRHYTRQILFAHAGVAVVLDRLERAHSTSTATWHLQLPARPEVVAAPSASGTSGKDPQNFPAARQLHGLDARAGIWELAGNAEWVSVMQGDGRLFVRTLLPESAQRRLIGGPMSAREIPAGNLAGAPYFGGDLLGYEHRLWPASFLQGPNAAYELGRPTLLGPNFGVGATWGRYEVAPTDTRSEVIFLNVLVPTDTTTHAPPAIEFKITENTAGLQINLPDQRVAVDLPLSGEPTGHITLRHPATGAVLREADFGGRIEPTRPLPTGSPH